MSEHGTESAGEGVSQPGTTARLDQGDSEGSGAIMERFTNPGLRPHVPRSADLDEKAAHRAERQVAALFGISMVATVIFLVAYFAIDQKTYESIPGIGQASLSNVVLGVSLGVSLLCIGLGAVLRPSPARRRRDSHLRAGSIPDWSPSDDQVHPRGCSWSLRPSAGSAAGG